MPIIKNTNFDPTDRKSQRFLSINGDTASNLFGLNSSTKTSTPSFLRGPIDFTAGGAIKTPEKQEEVKGAFNNLPNDVIQTFGNGSDQEVNETVQRVSNQQSDPDQQSLPGSDSLATLAAEAGMTTSQFLSLLGKKTQVSPDERAQLEDEAGIPGLISKRFTTPTVNTQAKFNELFNATDLPSLKKRISERNEEISARKAKFIKDKTAHTNNPWLSQETRSARIARERDLANDELQLLIDDKQTDVDLFNQGLELIEDEITRFSKDNEADREMTVDKLNFLTKQVDQSVKKLEAEREEDNLRFVPDFLKAKIKGDTSKKTPSGASFFGEDGEGLTSPTAVTPIQSFDDFIKDRQNEAQQSFTAQKRESLKAEYERDTASLKEKNERAKEARNIGRLSAEARSAIKNPSLFHNSFTPSTKQEILAELERAGIDAKSIARGKKRAVSSTTADDLVQARAAKEAFIKIGQLVEEISVQGPGVGALRRANPFDNKIVRLNNLITQAIPGLARGIFKEVGVLTDTDVERYTRTVANESLTNEQARQATEDLLERIEMSIDLQIETLDALGYEVGDFSDLIGGTGATAEESSLNDDDAWALYQKKTKK